jgi:extradiol dioxygenase family protein
MLGMTTTAIRITGVDFAYVPVTDFDAAKHFYGDVLGLK